MMIDDWDSLTLIEPVQSKPMQAPTAIVELATTVWMSVLPWIIIKIEIALHEFMSCPDQGRDTSSWGVSRAQGINESVFIISITYCAPNQPG